jgi:hypothetical protein
MATAKVNGADYSIPPNRPYSGANQNNGTMKANNVTSDVINSVSTSRPIVAVFGSTVLDNNVADKAVSGGVFANDNAKPISALVTSELAGLSNDAIKSPGNDGAVIRGIHKFESDESALLATGIRANKLSLFTGQWEEGYPSGVTVSFSQDDAANPTASVPGELTYMTGAKTPFNDDYAPKTNY